MRHRCRLGPAGPVGTVFLLLCLADVCAAADFSADIVGGNTTPAKIYSADGKVRIETPEVTTGFFLVDGKVGTAVFVRPNQQIFTDARQSSRLTRLFIPVDPENPCSQWQAAARNAGIPGADGEWRCERIDGGKAGDGRPVTQWRVISPNQGSSQYWIDSSLRFPVRMRMSDGATLALENIRVATQSADLFTIPSNYRKLDPQSLLERIKHSDVWVESPGKSN
jgi:hypothetical protein